MWLAAMPQEGDSGRAGDKSEMPPPPQAPVSAGIAAPSPRSLLQRVPVEKEAGTSNHPWGRSFTRQVQNTSEEGVAESGESEAEVQNVFHFDKASKDSKRRKLMEIMSSCGKE